MVFFGGHYEFYDIRCGVLSVRDCILRLALGGHGNNSSINAHVENKTLLCRQAFSDTTSTMSISRSRVYPRHHRMILKLPTCLETTLPLYVLV